MSADLAPAVWPMLTAAGVAIAGIAALLGQPWWQRRRRAQLRAQPFPAAWRRILRTQVPAVARLPPDLQQRLKQHIQVFLAEKPFVGCAGQPITDEVRVTIAAQACLLLLGRADAEGYPRLSQVLVYPGAFAVQASQAAAGGVVHEQRQVLAGQSWAHGQVVLGWAEVRAGAADPGDGQNVVLHEFAHQVDQDKGVADGRPWQPGRARRRRWAAVMDAAFDRAQQQPDHPLAGYATTAPAEFFAVATELFFEQPQALATVEPDVYRELALLFQVHPLAW
jgi:hypothetical protein